MLNVIQSCYGKISQSYTSARECVSSVADHLDRNKKIYLVGIGALIVAACCYGLVGEIIPERTRSGQILLEDSSPVPSQVSSVLRKLKFMIDRKAEAKFNSSLFY